MHHSNDFSDTIYAIQHLSFEDLGAWEDVCYESGFRVRYFEAGVDNLQTAFAHPGLVVILGGPIGVHDQNDFPFLTEEIHYLQQRLAQKLPTLGICLGAQLIAHALGAKVYTGTVKEIGWSCLNLLPIAAHPLQALENIPVLHWHADSFDLPDTATLLASSSLYPHQAFSVDSHVLALQFHAEISAEQLEKWLIGHAIELKHAGISIPQLRQQNQENAALLQHAAKQVITTFIQKFTS